MTVPQLTVGNLHDERHRFDQYWERLQQLNVPTPTTKIIQLEDKEPFPECPTDAVLEFMLDKELYTVFVRSGYKAAVDRLRDGSIINRQDRGEIEATVRDLLTQHVRNEIPHGNLLVVRDRLDLDYCLEPSHSHAVEIRYFIDQGQVLSQTPVFDSDSLIPTCPATYPFIEERFTDVENPLYLAERVATEFADSPYSWSVDVVLDAHGNWWVTEMHINGVYWNTQHETWWNICGQGHIEHLSPLWYHEAALPYFS